MITTYLGGGKTIYHLDTGKELLLHEDELKQLYAESEVFLEVERKNQDLQTQIDAREERIETLIYVKDDALEKFEDKAVELLELQRRSCKNCIHWNKSIDICSKFMIFKDIGACGSFHEEENEK